MFSPQTPFLGLTGRDPPSLSSSLSSEDPGHSRSVLFPSAVYCLAPRQAGIQRLSKVPGGAYTRHSLTDEEAGPPSKGGRDPRCPRECLLDATQRAGQSLSHDETDILLNPWVIKDMGITTLLLGVRNHYLRQGSEKRARHGDHYPTSRSEEELLRNRPTVTVAPKPTLSQQAGHSALGALLPAHKPPSRVLLHTLSSGLARKPPPVPWPVPLVSKTQVKIHFSFSLLETLFLLQFSYGILS